MSKVSTFLFKKSLFLLSFITLFLCFAKVQAQTWETFGQDGPASAGVYSAGNIQIAVSPSGTPYALYRFGGGGAFWVLLTYSQGYWDRVNENGINLVNSVSLALNGEVPYISCYEVDNGIVLKKFENGVWTNVGSTISSSSSTVTSLAFVGQTPYVAYRSTGSPAKAIVKKFDGTNWVAVGPEQFSVGTANFMSLRSDGNNPYITYTDTGLGDKVVVKKYTGLAWTNVGTEGSIDPAAASNASLAFKGTTPYVSYRASISPGKATVKKFNGTTWDTEGSPNFSAGTANSLSMAFSGETPYVVYQDGAAGNKTTVKKLSGTDWVTVGDGGFPASNSTSQSIAIRNGKIYVAYNLTSDPAGLYVKTFDTSNLSALSFADQENPAVALPMSPSFSSGNTSYSTTVAGSVAGVYITSATVDADASRQVRVNGGAYGDPLGLLPLNVGINTIDIKVTAEDGVTTKLYTINVERQIPVPSLASFSPAAGGPDAIVTLTGTNFTGTQSVSFGGTPASSFTVNSSTSISAVVGNGTSGSVAIVTPWGTSSQPGFNYIPPVPATALNFDGADDYVTTPAIIANLPAFTVEGWVKWTGIGTAAIYTETTPGDDNPMFSMIAHSNGFEVVLRNGANIGLVAFPTSGKLTPNQWTHVAFARTSTTTGQLFINGIKTDDFSFDDPGLINVNTGNIGVRRRGHIDGYMNGSVDELRIWSRALCSGEILHNLNTELNPAGQNSLLSLYHFNQGNVHANNASQSLLTDASGNNRTGSLQNFSLTGLVSNWIEGKASGTVSVFTQSVTAGNNGPIASGGTLNLTSTGSGTFSWTGPNNYSSSLQNPVITNATTTRSGTYTVTVTQNGCSTSASTAVVVNIARPVVASVSLSTSSTGVASLTYLPISGGTTLKIYGANFASGMTINAAVTGTVSIISSTVASFTLKPSAAGTALILNATNSGGTSTNTSVILNYAPVPTISSVQAASAPGAVTSASGITNMPISGGTVIINGVNFGTNVNDPVMVNVPVTGSVSHLSNTQIRFTLAAGTPDSVLTGVKVSTSGGQSTTTGFSITYASKPAITSLSPVTVSAAAGNIITLTGTNLGVNAASIVSITYGLNGTENIGTARTWISSSQVRFTAGALTAGTTYKVIITTGGGSSEVSASTFSTPPATGPASINDGITLWLDASDVNAGGSTLSNGTIFTTWRDKSGNAHNAVKYGTQNGVTYLTNQVNDKPVVRFTRVNDSQGSVLEATGVDVRAGSNPDVTMFTVYKPGIRNETSGQGQSLWGNDNGAWDRFFYTSWSHTDDGIASLGTVEPTFVSIPGAGVLNKLRLMTAVFDGTVSGVSNSGPSLGSAIYFDGKVVTKFTDNTDPFQAFSTLRIGNDGDNGSFNGDIAEMIVYNRKLTDCEIQTINEYLSLKYGVVFTTATITPSGSTTICANSSVNLTASAGTSFQWFVNGTLIEGATSQTYSATTTGNYTVRIINASGCSATSAATAVIVNPLLTAAITASGTTTICPSGSVTLSANTGAGLTYQWTKNGASIEGATTSSYTANTAGSYNVTVTQNNCTATATAVSVTIEDTQTPVIANVPADASVQVGAIPSFPTLSATDNCTVGAVTGYQLPTNSLASTITHNYKFDNNFNDSKGNATGTSVNGLGFAPGIIGSALSFDGSNKFVNYGTSASLSGKLNFAISAWIKTSSSQPQAIIQQRDGDFNGQYMLVVGSNHAGNIVAPGKVYFMVYNNGFQFEIYSNQRVDDGKWHHIVAERDGATGRVYIDGTVDGSARGPIVSLTPTIGTYVGRDVRDGSKNFNGLIDELKIYNGGTCPSSYDLERTWSVSDISGNRTVAQQILSVTDTIAPVLSANPANITASCNAIPNAEVLTATDNSGVAPTVVYTQTSTQSADVFSASYSNYTLTRTWKATDACGNVTAHTQTIQVLSPEVGLAGNNNPVTSGTNTTSANNNTDFGGTFPGNAINKQFVIQNSGSSPLTISAINVSGTNASDFSVASVDLPLTVAANTSASFGINFSSAAIGVRNANVALVSDDCNESNYTFAIKAEITCSTPAFTRTTFPVQFSTPANSCNLAVNYPLAVTGIPQPVITYTLSGATEGAGSGTASGTIFNKGITHVTVAAVNPCGTISYNFDITVIDDVKPTVLAKAATAILSASGNASITVTDINEGSTDNCGIASIDVSPEVFTGANLGPNTVTLTVTDLSGNVQTGTSTVTVKDITPPVFTSTQEDAIFPLNSQNGTAQLADYTAAATATDNSGVPVVFTQLPAAGTALVRNIATDVTLTATDGSGLTASQSFTVTATDQTAPVVVAKNITIQLNNLGKASINAEQLDNGSSDNVGITNLSIDKKDFDCSNVNTEQGVAVALTAVDAAGNSSNAIAFVTVEDKVAPIVLTQNITVQLDANGKASITEALINNGSSDNCSIASIALNKKAFDCSNVGANTVTLTVIDVNGNVASANAVVTVEDKVIPIVLTQNITVQLDANGKASISEAQINNGSSDNCSIASIALNKKAFDCSNVGANTATLIVIDVNGNLASANATVTVQDNIAPVAIAQNVSVQLNASGNASTSAAAVNNGSTDACGIKSITLSKTDFDCSNVGANPVVLTVTDVNGNVSTANATVTVQDNIAPVALAQNVTIQLNASGNASTSAAAVNNGSTDACGIQSITLSKTDFDCSNVGANAVVLTVTDVNGNVSTASATVTIQDNIAPVALAQNVTIQLNASGNASTSAAAVNNNSTDNCGIKAITLSKTDFNCSNVGQNAVTLTVTDVNGNVSTASSAVAVQDNIAPTVLTQNLLVQLNANGTASITESQINNNSSDNCSIASYSLDKKSFDCSNVGVNKVTLTVADVNGNTSSATANVTVEDKVAPVALTKNISVTLVNGSASITAASVDNGSNDACGIQSLSVNKSSFDCSNLGNNTVVLTVTDKNGNVSSATAVVKVIGVTPVASIAVSRTDATFTGLDSKTIALGYGAQRLTLTASNSTSAAGATTYQWSPSVGLSNPSIANPMFTPTAAGSYTFSVIATNEFGCSASTSVTIRVVDVRCGNKNDKVLVCHKTGSSSNPSNEICVSANAVDAQLKKGGTLGACGSTTSATTLALNTTASSTTLAALPSSDLMTLSNSLTQSDKNTLAVYPNPFANETTVSFTLIAEAAKVSLDLYDLKGVRMANIYSGSAEAFKNYSFPFDGKSVPAGAYFFRLTGGGNVLNFKIIVGQ